jgi:hypothetical protein
MTSGVVLTGLVVVLRVASAVVVTSGGDVGSAGSWVLVDGAAVVVASSGSGVLEDGVGVGREVGVEVGIAALVLREFVLTTAGP